MIKINHFNSTKTFIKALFLLLLIISLQSFKAISQTAKLSMQQKMDIALKFAGGNKAELLQVIDHYSRSARDSLKLRATYFLIGNMTGHFSYTGYQQQGLDSLIQYGNKLKQITGVSFWQPENAAKIECLWKTTMGNAASTHSGPDYLFDNKVISAKLLIENIEYAFKAWSMPWSQHLTFNEFCNYVLPYRFYDEPLQSWRPRYMQKFSWVIKAMGKGTDPVLACNLINESLRYEFPYDNQLVRYGHALGPNGLLDGGLGKCLDQAGIAIFAMRAMGVPVTLEVVRQWANRSFGHDFNSVLAKDGTFVPFMGAEFPPYQYQLPYVAPKIYCLGYAIQNDSSIADEISTTGMLSPDLMRFQTDATRKHIAARNLLVTMRSGSVKPGERVYLCVFDNRHWVPVAASSTDDGKTVSFNDIGLGAIYLPMVSRDSLTPVSSPLMLSKDQSVTPILINRNQTDSIKISRKYPLSREKLNWLWLMQGGKFEGANQPDFSDVRPLYTIQDPFYMMLNKRQVMQSNFRYVRYCFPENTHGSLAEICFYGDSIMKQPLKGMPIHSSKVTDRDAQLAFDGMLGNFINTPDSSNYNNEWLGLDLGRSQGIAGVGFSPRNDENGIEQSMEYELYYWDDRWVSLGNGNKIIGQETKLKFFDVPRGALLWLRNHNTGNEERIFRYDNNMQQWW